MRGRGSRSGEGRINHGIWEWREGGKVEDETGWSRLLRIANFPTASEALLRTRALEFQTASDLPRGRGF